MVLRLRGWAAEEDAHQGPSDEKADSYTNDSPGQIARIDRNAGHWLWPEDAQKNADQEGECATDLRLGSEWWAAARHFFEVSRKKYGMTPLSITIELTNVIATAGFLGIS